MSLPSQDQCSQRTNEDLLCYQDVTDLYSSRRLLEARVSRLILLAYSEVWESLNASVGYLEISIFWKSKHSLNLRLPGGPTHFWLGLVGRQVSRWWRH